MLKECSECVYWSESGDGNGVDAESITGTCRRYPPNLPDIGDIHGTDRQPKTLSNDRCGEFEDY